MPYTQILDASGPHRPPRSRRRIGLLSVVGAVVLGLIAGGGIYAYQLLSGGGAQPEQYVPANAIAFIKVDLDPAAGQKLAAREFFGHFPGAAEAFESSDDIRKILFELAQRDDEALAALDYEEDIEPWLGDRVGIAVLPTENADDDPPTIAVLQVKDRDQAETGLRELSEATDSDPPAMVFAGSYAILGEDEATVEGARDAAAEASLADDEEFSADFDAFGDGVGAFWIDLESVGDLLSEADPTVAESPGLEEFLDGVYTGRMAGVLSFDGSYAEFTVRGFDSNGFGIPPSSAEPVGPLFQTLPQDSMFAVAWSGLDVTMADAWDAIVNALEAELGDGSVDAQIDQLESELGIRLPDDLLTLLGHQTLIAVAADSPDTPPTFAYRAETDGASAEEVLGVLEDALDEMGIPLPVVWEVDGSTLLIGASPADLSAIQSGTGIADEAAQTALPNLDQAVQALWIDLDKFTEVAEADLTDVDPEDLEIMQHIAGIGATMTVADDGTWTSTIRVVAD